MVFNTEEAARRAENAKTNVPGMCQQWTREIFGVDSAGDRDHDGDADAVDGWLSEPKSARHTDRRPPRGKPVSFSGGGSGHGHRAVSLGNGMIRSTDMGGNHYNPGVVGTTTIEQIERSMGVKYLGWSDTITNVLIPKPETRKGVFGKRVSHALKDLQSAKAKNKGKRLSHIKEVIRLLKKTPKHYS